MTLAEFERAALQQTGKGGKEIGSEEERESRKKERREGRGGKGRRGNLLHRG